jgi:5-formyltetrahydrofolate cyclo-ligase
VASAASGPSPALAEAKTRLRAEARALRERLVQPGAADAVAQHILASGLIRPGARVSGYLAIGSELDPAPVLAALAARGHATLMPVVAARGEPLLFRRWRPGEPLVQGPLGTRMPHPDAPVEAPDVLLTPLLAFDAAGYRLGYGGGYYDRTLRLLRADKAIAAIGLAYAGQEVDNLPRHPGDERLDAVATERGVRVFR